MKPKVEQVPAWRVNVGYGWKYYHSFDRAAEVVADAMFMRIVRINHKKRGSGGMYKMSFDYQAWNERMLRRVTKVMKVHYNKTKVV